MRLTRQDAGAVEAALDLLLDNLDQEMLRGRLWILEAARIRVRGRATMPSYSLKLSVSRREADRPRLLQLVALDAAGERAGGLDVTVEMDENGTFADEDRVSKLALRTGADGEALFQWYEWPRNGQARDFTSTVTATWDDESAIVCIEDLYE